MSTRRARAIDPAVPLTVIQEEPGCQPDSMPSACRIERTRRIVRGEGPLRLTWPGVSYRPNRGEPGVYIAVSSALSRAAFGSFNSMMVVIGRSGPTRPKSREDSSSVANASPARRTPGAGPPGDALRDRAQPDMTEAAARQAAAFRTLPIN